MGFNDQLASLVYGDDKENADKKIRFYSFYYNANNPKAFSYEPMLHSNDRKDLGEKKSEEQLDAENMQAAREGKLFVVSEKPPYLQKVNVDDNGNITLETVTKNPIEITENMGDYEKQYWTNMKEKFDKLIDGNTATNAISSTWYGMGAKSVAREIADIVKKTDKREAEWEKKALARQQKENLKAEKEAREKEIAASEAAKKEELGKLDNNGIGNLVKEGKYADAAAAVAMRLQNLSDTFKESKLFDDQKGIDAGMEIKMLLSNAKNCPEVYDKLRKNPAFKQNKNLYQGQANLAEMADKGVKAMSQLSEFKENAQPDENKKQDLILDVMAGEAAVALKNYEAMKSMMETLSKQKDSVATTEAFKTMLKDTNQIKNLKTKSTKEISESFKDSFAKQKSFSDAFNSAKGKIKKNKEKIPEKVAEKKKENGNVLQSESNKKKQISMGMQ